MSKIVLSVVGATLIALSSAQGVQAAEHHRAGKARTVTSEQFRNARNAVAAPASQPAWPYSGFSAPAGH
jgi:hypothetical protein